MKTQPLEETGISWTVQLMRHKANRLFPDKEKFFRCMKRRFLVNQQKYVKSGRKIKDEIFKLEECNGGSL